MNRCGVGIEDVMSKITELNIYGKYIDEVEEEDNEETPQFVDEMIKISPKDAESLLDEIDNLSSVMEDLDLPVEDEKPELLKPENPKMEEDSFDDITNAVSDFVDKYETMQDEITTKDEKIRQLQLEIEKLDKISDEKAREREDINQEIKSLKASNDKYRQDNEKLQQENEKLKAKLAKSAEILNKIYQSVSKK